MTIFRRRGYHASAIDYMLGFGRVVASRVEGAAKAVLLSIRGLQGDEANENEDSDGEPVYGSLGVVGRPRGTVTGEAATGTNPEGYCEVMGARFGDQFQPIACRDLRINAKVNPKEGQLFFAQYGGGFLSLEDASDGRGTLATLYAPRLLADGTTEKANALMLDPAQGACALVQQDGAALTLSADGAIMKSKEGTFFELNDRQAKTSAPNVFTYTGDFLLYVPNESNTLAHAIHVSDSGGSISIVHRTGAAIMMNSTGQIILRSVTGNTVATLDDDGLFVNGNLKVQGSLLVAVGLPAVGGIFAVGATMEQLAQTIAGAPNPALLTSAVIHGINGVAGVPSVSAFVFQ